MMHRVHFSKKRSQNHTINGTVKVKLKAFQNNPKWKKEYNVVHFDKQRRTLYLTPKPKAELTKQAVVSLQEKL
uniref:Uncharacterized protein n=1 Tax=viral metagenome TaxID=1070528 RepID=A0A6M3K9N1_9ZZZZ